MEGLTFIPYLGFMTHVPINLSNVTNSIGFIGNVQLHPIMQPLGER